MSGKQQRDAEAEDIAGRHVASAERAEATKKGMEARGFVRSDERKPDLGTCSQCDESYDLRTTHRCKVPRRQQVPSPGVGEAKAALNEARICLEEARQALAYRSGEVDCADLITLCAYAQVAVSSALNAARSLSEKEENKP